MNFSLSRVPGTLETAFLSVLFRRLPGGGGGGKGYAPRLPRVDLVFGVRKAPQKMSRPVLSEICPLLYKTVLNTCDLFVRASTSSSPFVNGHPLYPGPGHIEF